MDKKNRTMITDELLFRFLNGEASRKEDRLVRSWLASDTAHEARLIWLRDFTETAGLPDSGEELLADWQTLEKKLKNEPSVARIHQAPIVRLARIAAVLLVLAGSVVLWFNHTNTHVIRNYDEYTKCIFLPDGSQVDLGPGSKLIYVNDFLNGNRVVRLSGEAYFDVISDSDHPFTVVAGVAKIRVTGTRFVVNAPRHSEEVEVTVKSGKVLFYNSDTPGKNSFRTGLTAGERGIFYSALNRMDKTSDPYFHSTP